MTDREKLIKLLCESHSKSVDSELFEGASYAQQIEVETDFLIANGVTITPAVPGPSESDPNIMELCFHNGEQRMKEKMISQLRSVAGSMTCITLSQAIKMVEEL